MTPTQKIRHATLLCLAETQLLEITEDNVDLIYETYKEEELLCDIVSDFRSGEVETGLQAGWDRHYESKAVAAQMPDGSYVGWTFWYGGGKYGEPEAIDWMGEPFGPVARI